MSYGKFGLDSQSVTVRNVRFLISAEVLEVYAQIQVGIAVSRRQTHSGLEFFFEGVRRRDPISMYAVPQVRVYLRLVGG